MTGRGRRVGAALALGLGLAPPASAQGVRELALAWAVGDFRAPLTCVVDEVPREALRRILIRPAPAHTARPALRLRLFDLAAPPETRCISVSGEPEPNVIGTLSLVFEGRTRPDTGEVDFRNALRRDGGFDFKIESGRLRIAPVDAGAAAARTVDFAGGAARLEVAAPGSDAARRLASFGGRRERVLRLEAPGEAPLSFELVELER